MTYAKKIKNLRLSMGMTQKEFAVLVDISTRYVQVMENPKEGEPQKHLKREKEAVLIKTANLSPNYFITNEDIIIDKIDSDQIVYAKFPKAAKAGFTIDEMRTILDLIADRIIQK